MSDMKQCDLCGKVYREPEFRYVRVDVTERIGLDCPQALIQLRAIEKVEADRSERFAHVHLRAWINLRTKDNYLAGSDLCQACMLAAVEKAFGKPVASALRSLYNEDVNGIVEEPARRPPGLEHPLEGVKGKP